MKIKKALLSVSDKTEIVELARELVKLKISILSTGGTAALLKKSKVPCTEIADYTASPEMLGGRVKTLHPKVHGGILARRADKKDQAELKKYKIEPIDLVVVNLYPFEETVKKGDRVQGSGGRKKNKIFQEAIEQIDIGGVTLLRSAAKNHEHVVVVSDPVQYADLAAELKKNKGAVSKETASRWAVGAFMTTASYDKAIAQYLTGRGNAILGTVPFACPPPAGGQSLFPQHISIHATKVQDLRYGENPHQKAAWYSEDVGAQFIAPPLKQLHGKELSFNNLLDLDAALALVSEFKEPTAAVIKHMSPCGVSQAPTLTQAFQEAFDTDPVSAFGGIIGFNRLVDDKTAKAIVDAGFLECLVAPGYSDKALEILRQKKNLRVIVGANDHSPLRNSPKKTETWDVKRIHGGLLVQECDTTIEDPKQWKVVTQRHPTPEQLKSTLFTWKVAKWTRSNAIVICQGTKTVGICGGQPSRVESVRIAVRKAGHRAVGSVLASDAFFPMPDNVQVASLAGISCIVQPGGSIKDPEVIAKADDAGIAMVFTGVRHFKH
ncbi:MAG: bifunctional phosphoribosylaminoimidazolecarboxamide formyltransferase/IMP cyclohydrolase [Candidatus Omnitrophica bacterium]|nr:bifunctional phosphoribosylaminoimidazolecarboxamide formyltransferase/IMP cyclohydrolase [Candidatus Omnitrophota bacterium]